MLRRTVNSSAIVLILLNEDEKGAEENTALGTAMVLGIAIVIVIDVENLYRYTKALITQGNRQPLRGRDF